MMIVKCENCGDLIEDNVGPLLNTSPPSERWAREAINLLTKAMVELYDSLLTSEQRHSEAAIHAELFYKLMRDTRLDEV